MGGPHMAKHGASGYRGGCRCEVCTTGKRDETRAVRARRGGARPPKAADRAPLPPIANLPAPNPVQGSGLIESAVTVELAAIVGEPPWRGTLAAMLRTNARLLDQIDQHGRYDLISALQMRMLDAMDRLRKTGAGSRAPADLSALLGEPD